MSALYTALNHKLKIASETVNVLKQQIHLKKTID